MPPDRESWVQQLVQYLFFTLAAGLISAFYLRVLHANQTTVALSFLILILFTAFRRRVAYSIYLSVLCTVLYNYYFLPPLGSLTIADPQNLIALLAFLVAGISVNHISAKERRQAHSLAKQSEEIEKLYAFSQRLLLEDKLQQLSNSVPGLIAQTLRLRAVALYLPDHEDAWMWDPEHLLTGMENLHDATQLGGVSSRSTAGIRIVPLMLGMRALGVLAMAEGGYSESFYDAIGSLTAVSIERASALERNSRSEAAREGELLRTALLDSITHELRTPLTGIRIAATTLSGNARLDEDARQDLLSVINEETTRMDALIDESVTMAQLSAGEFNLRREPKDFGMILDAVLDNLRVQLRGREVRLDVAAHMPPVVLDADLIRRVLKHLLENALQYSPAKSPIALSAKLVGGKLHLSVLNGGSGIAEEEQPYVFDRVFRGANGIAHPNGTGMGLAIVKAIVEAHQGRISVRSTPGHGAEFSFWIPAVVEQNPA
jgi:two-component system sensor histidine kinase KdpD